MSCWRGWTGGAPARPAHDGAGMIRRALQPGGRDAEGKLHDFCADHYADLLGYVRAAFPWGEPGTILAQYPGPRVWQCELLGIRFGQRDGAEHSLPAIPLTA